ncbi:MAG: hypothetical protein ACP5P1_14775 [Acidimicrobiales bacterium]
MRGVSQLAFPAGHTHPDLVDLPPGHQAACFVCGQPAQGWGRKSSYNKNGCLSDAFNDDNKLPRAGIEMCAPCFSIAKMSAPADTSPVNIVKVPKGSPGWFIADGTITKLPCGLGGITHLAGLCQRDKPFAVMVGWGNPKVVAHHWMVAPVAHPAPRWPALHITSAGALIVWMSASEINTLEDTLQRNGIDDDTSLHGLYKKFFSSNSRHQNDPAVQAVSAILGGRGGSVRQSVLTRILFYGLGSSAGKRGGEAQTDNTTTPGGAPAEKEKP